MVSFAEFGSKEIDCSKKISQAIIKYQQILFQKIIIILRDYLYLFYHFAGYITFFRTMPRKLLGQFAIVLQQATSIPNKQFKLSLQHEDLTKLQLILSSENQQSHYIGLPQLLEYLQKLISELKSSQGRMKQIPNRCLSQNLTGGVLAGLKDQNTSQLQQSLSLKMRQMNDQIKKLSKQVADLKSQINNLSQNVMKLKQTQNEDLDKSLTQSAVGLDSQSQLAVDLQNMKAFQQICLIRCTKKNSVYRCKAPIGTVNTFEIKQARTKSGKIFYGIATSKFNIAETQDVTKSKQCLVYNPQSGKVWHNTTSEPISIMKNISQALKIEANRINNNQVKLYLNNKAFPIVLPKNMAQQKLLYLAIIMTDIGDQVELNCL